MADHQFRIRVEYFVRIEPDFYDGSFEKVLTVYPDNITPPEYEEMILDNLGIVDSKIREVSDVRMAVLLTHIDNIPIGAMPSHGGFQA